MIIQHNMTSINTNRQLSISTDNKKKAVERLSSGFRINGAADDAAGLAVSETMRWSIRGLHQASRNIEDGISLTQVADGGMSEIHAILQRQRELAVQAGNDTNTPADRNAIQHEINQLSVEITRIANDTTFNTHQILNKAGNLTHGPVGPNTAITMLLNNPGSAADGTLTGFMASNAAGTIQSNLLYGSGVASTSPFQVEVSVGNPPTVYSMQSGIGIGSNVTVVNDTTSVANGVKTTFTYADANGNNIFSVVRTMTKITNPTGDGGEVYKMDFSVENHTTDNISVDLEVGMDVMFDGNDNPSFLMDGNNQETIIERPIKYPDAGGNMPGVINLFDTNNPYLNVQCIVDGYGASTPDYVKIGQFGAIMGNAWSTGVISDSMYTVGWDNVAIGAGGTSGSYTTMYGVSDPLRNPILAGSHSIPVEINIQASDRANNAIRIPLVNCTAGKLGIDNLSVMSHGDAGVALGSLDKAIDKISEHRAMMGAICNRLEKAQNNVNNMEENTQAAESLIRDADMAEEMVSYSTHNILEQTGQAMLAQAGKMKEGVLALLQ